MFLLLLQLAFSLDVPNRIQAMISRDQITTDGGAYIVRAFNMNQKEFILQSSAANQIDALLWYPSGKIHARFKDGKTKYLGQGNPAKLSQTVNFYFPEDLKLRLKQDVKVEESRELRTVTQKAIVRFNDGEDLFFESSQIQILQDNQWVIP